MNVLFHRHHRLLSASTHPISDIYACLLFSISPKNSIAYDYAGAAVSKASEFRACTQGASSFLLASLQGPIESVCLCGQVNDISLRVVFNHKQTNEIGWAGVTSAINSITSRSLTASLSLSLFLFLSFLYFLLFFLSSLSKPKNEEI